MKVSAQTYVISDHHFFHKNIVQYAQRPDHHMEILVKEHNTVVTPNDKVLFLGDLTFSDKEKTKGMIDRLMGTKYLILGNHDHHNDGWYRDLGFEVSEPIFKIFNDNQDAYPVLFTHHPVQYLPDTYYNIHGHIHRGVKTDFPLTDRHYNVSCEVLNYRPITIASILEKWKNLRYSGKS